MWGFITAFIFEDGIYKYADQLAVFNEMLSKHSEYQIISWNLPEFKDLLYRAPNYINSTIKDDKRMFETIERKEDAGLVSKPFVGGVGSKTASIPETNVSFALTGRNCQALHSPVLTQKLEGIVVVEIAVDRKGKVITAKPGVKGTTTMDETLWEAARNSALRAAFEPKVNGPEIQKGLITYRFRLQ